MRRWRSASRWSVLFLRSPRRCISQISCYFLVFVRGDIRGPRVRVSVRVIRMHAKLSFGKSCRGSKASEVHPAAPHAVLCPEGFGRPLRARARRLRRSSLCRWALLPALLLRWPRLACRRGRQRLNTDAGSAAEIWSNVLFETERNWNAGAAKAQRAPVTADPDSALQAKQEALKAPPAFDTKKASL